MYKPKPIEGLKIKYDNKEFSNITYLSCSNNELHFENLDGKGITTNVICKITEAKITME